MNLTKDEEKIVFQIAEKITGASQQSVFLLRNVEKRIKEKNLRSLSSYLDLVKDDASEYMKFVSDLTIHTTSWFRESPHYDLLEKIAIEHNTQNNGESLNVWSAACSTGEEVYSAALVLEKYSDSQKKEFKYFIYGSDIDDISVEKAKKCVFTHYSTDSIDKSYAKFLLKGENKLTGLFTLDASIRKKANFFVQSLADEIIKTPIQKFNVIFCRNVLIYFSAEMQKKIVNQLVKKLSPSGVLILGHCDSFLNHPDLVSLGHSSYRNKQAVETKATVSKLAVEVKKKSSILIIDDSKTIRSIIRKIFSKSYDIFEASSTSEATEVLKNEKISFITLDLNMPDENGAAWLLKMRQLKMKIPTIIVSDSQPEDAEKVFGALSAGAEDYLVKSKLHAEPQTLLDFAQALIVEKESAKLQNYKLRSFSNTKHKPEVVLAGASTGGPEALIRLFAKLPADFPPLVIVQHIGSEFSKALLNRLCESSGLQPGTIQDGQPLSKGKIYFSQGDYHLSLKSINSKIFVEKNMTDKVEGHRPSVDVLFESASRIPFDCLGILLTGMGRDGASGLLKMVESNRTFSLVQDAASSVVFGMPKKAIENGSACFVGNIEEIRSEMLIRLGFKL